MNIRPSFDRGITLVEIIISLIILLILGTLGTQSLIEARKAKQLEVTADAIAARLQEAKGYAMSGRDGTNFGLAISSTTYTLWRGSAYSSSDPNNIATPFPEGLIVNTSLASPNYSVMFAKVTGNASAAGTIKISRVDNPVSSSTIVIGSLGDITVIK